MKGWGGVTHYIGIGEGHSRQRKDFFHMSNKKGMGKETMIYIHNEMFLSHKEECSHVCRELHATGDHSTEFRKSCFLQSVGLIH